jgi:hypothetical protein
VAGSRNEPESLMETELEKIVGLWLREEHPGFGMWGAAIDCRVCNTFSLVYILDSMALIPYSRTLNVADPNFFQEINKTLTSHKICHTHQRALTQKH